MKKFENYKNNLKILKRAEKEDLTNDFIPEFVKVEKEIIRNYEDVLDII